ncbi:MAG: hypothetical protein WC748_09665 [Legionellales bacterium]|jgi:opacity protein-like surface antigen
MNKYISACVMGLCASPTAFASAIGTGFYFTLGVGGGPVDYQQANSFDLDYQTLYDNIFTNDELNQAVLDNYNDTVQYSDASENVLGGRAAIGYMWDIFEGEPTKIGDALYKFNATLGLELGYRLFDNVETSPTTETVQDTSHEDSDTPNCTTPEGEDCFFVDQTATNTIHNQAIDISAVARLPFTEDNRLALLLKGGVAYNFYEVDTTITIEADTGNPPTQPLPYDRTITEKQSHNEFLPVVGAALEYMVFTNVGVAAEYSAIFGSKHNADTQLITGNLVFRF